MADIRTFPLVRHLRAEPTAHVLRFRRGRLVQEGAGAAFWFRPIHTAIAEVPVDDRELPFIFRVRTADFQQVTVQGAITFRVTDPARLARRVDFAIDLDEGVWHDVPLEQVGGLLTQLAQQFVIDALARDDLRTILAGGVAPIRERITAGLDGEPALADLGLEVAAVRVAAVTPTAEMEKALAQPTREAVQEGADEATFQRRALAVEKERAIAENELINRVELARRQEELVGQEGANERRRAEEQAAAQGIEARAADERVRLAAQREADTTRQVGEAQLAVERDRAGIQGAMAPEILLALALRELAGQLGQIDHLTVTPDLIAPLVQRVAAKGDGAGEGAGRGGRGAARGGQG